MKKSFEVWHTPKGKVRTIAVRDERGEFARGNASGNWGLEIWETSKGTVVKAALRRPDGTFLPQTNLPLR